MAEKKGSSKKGGSKEGSAGSSGRCSCRKIVLVLIVLAVPLAMLVQYLLGRIGHILTNVGGAGSQALLMTRVVLDIRSATEESQPWYFVPPSFLPDIKGMLMYEGFKALFGLTFVHTTVTWGIEHLFLYPQDEESRMCRAMLNYMWVSPQTSFYSYPSIYAGYAQQKEWIKACKAEWPNLGDEEKHLLQPFRAAGGFNVEVLVPEVDKNAELKAEARAQKDFPIYENSEKMTREDIVELVRKSLAASAFGKYVGEEPPQVAIDYYTSMNMRKAIEIPATWTAVGKAIRAGQITKFDARGLLPKELFNVSFRTMKEWEGPASTRIPIFSDGRLPGSFGAWVNSKDHLVTEAMLRSPITIADTSLTTVNGVPSYDAAVRERVAAVSLHNTDMNPAGYIHTRRLPEFHKKLPNVEKLMGIEEDVLRGQSMLWLGSVGGGFHYDEEANVYVQLAGETFAFLVPQNWTNYFTGAIRHPWHSGGLPGVHELEKDPELKNVPIYLIHLRPGDGITLQGRTYHRFVAQTTNRISLNWFFIPKWRKMEYTPADWYSIEAKRSLTRLALRQLWARTLSRLFDDTGMGVVYMGTKLEYI